MRIALCQIRSVVGQVESNTQKILTSMEKAKSLGADLLVTPELAVIGYPVDDLLACRWIVEAEERAVARLQEASKTLGIGLLVGHTNRNESGWFWNAVTLFDAGEKIGSIYKRRLPSYGVFAEARHFQSYTKEQSALSFRDHRLGITVCEDAWDEVSAYGSLYPRRYDDMPPALEPSRKNCDLHINVSASPYEWGKNIRREKAFSALAQKLKCPLVWVNRTGAQDEVIFDGRSAVYSAAGEVIMQARAFAEELKIWDEKDSSHRALEQDVSPWADLSAALEIGVRDFVRQSGAKKVIVGLSGGIDSACVATIAAKALGPENVFGVSLPSELTSRESRDLAKELCEAQKIPFEEIPIDPTVRASCVALKLKHEGLAFENLQSRTRGLLLMAEANRRGALLLACGNKSEFATGYATLYGDIAGALAPIGDLFKSEVYGLSHFFNYQSAAAKKTLPIPERIIAREPTAELAPGQRDTDSLPPYSILDAFLHEIFEREGTGFVKKNWDAFLKPHLTVELLNRVMRAEFKRYQAPPILRVHTRSFGKSWAMPIATSSST